MLRHRYSHRTGGPFAPRTLTAHLPQPNSTESAPPTTSVDCWQLWIEQQAHFYRLCQHWLHNNQSDVDDAFSRAALMIWQKQQATAQIIANPMGWLTGLLRHVCLDVHRSRRRAAMRTVAFDACTETAIPAHRTFSNDSPETIVLRREKYAYISQAIDTLPPRLRTVILLRFYQEQRCEEIAVRLQLSVDNVYKRIQEARALLLHKLQIYQAGLEGPAPDAASLEDIHCPTTLAPAATSDDTVDPMQPRVAVLSHISKREKQKLHTLRAYVTSHPRGWKKRLALADQLCRMNYLQEALETYEQVLEIQPQLMRVWLQMGYVYNALGQSAAAVAAYERVLPLVTTAAMRADVMALIEQAAPHNVQKSKTSENS